MTTQVLLPVPDEVYQQAQSVAAVNGRDVSDVLSQVITWDIDALSDSPIMTEAERREEAAYVRLHPMLREKYPDQYVAIFQEKLVDHDTDLRRLHDRTIERFGDQFVWITAVDERPVETLTVYSSRLFAED